MAGSGGGTGRRMVRATPAVAPPPGCASAGQRAGRFVGSAAVAGGVGSISRRWVGPGRTSAGGSRRPRHGIRGRFWAGLWARGAAVGRARRGGQHPPRRPEPRRRGGRRGPPSGRRTPGTRACRRRRPATTGRSTESRVAANTSGGERTAPGQARRRAPVRAAPGRPGCAGAPPVPGRRGRGRGSGAAGIATRRAMSCSGVRRRPLEAEVEAAVVGDGALLPAEAHRDEALEHVPGDGRAGEPQGAPPHEPRSGISAVWIVTRPPPASRT